MHWWDEDWAANTEADIEVDDIGQTNLEHLASMMATLTGRRPAPSRTTAHTVRLSTRNLLVGGIDMDFEVKQGGRTLGTLSVSKGGLQWRSARNHRRKGKAKAGTRIRWSDFADWADQR